MDEQISSDQTQTNIPPGLDFAQLDPANMASLHTEHMNISVVPATETSHLTLARELSQPVHASSEASAQPSNPQTPVEALEQQIKRPEASSRLGQRLERHPRTIRMTKVMGAAAIIAEAVAACSSGHTSAAQSPKSSISSYAPSSSAEATTPNTTGTSPSHIPSITKYPGHSTPPPSETHTQSKLPYQEFPGYGKEVSQADIERIQASTVEIFMRYQGSTNPSDWVISCNGTKISVGGKVFIMSASHCLDLPSDAPDPNDPYQISKANKKPHPVDVTNQVAEQYGMRPANNPHAPIVTVNRIVESQVDASLLQADTKDPNIASYDQIPSISFDDPMLTMHGSPVNLQAEAGSTGSGSAVTVESAGTMKTSARVYLGRIQDPAQPGVYVDVWAENATSIHTDSGMFGSSGSSSLGYGGWVSGPETWRNDTSPTIRSADDGSLSQSNQFAAGVDANLGFSTKNFNVRIGTAVLTSSIIKNAAEVFNSPLPSPTH